MDMCISTCYVHVHVYLPVCATEIIFPPCRRFSNLKPIEMTSDSSHTRHKKSGSSGSKEDKEHSNSGEAHSTDS